MNENKIHVDKRFFQRGRKLLKQKQAAQGSKEAKMLEVPAEEPPRINLVQSEKAPTDKLSEG